MKLNKVLSIVMVALMLVCVSTNLFAVSLDDISKDKLDEDSDAVAGMESIGSTIISFITNAAMIVAVVIISVLGIKYMIGSAEEKAEYKKSMMPLLVGAVLVFGASTIAKIVTGLTF